MHFSFRLLPIFCFTLFIASCFPKSLRRYQNIYCDSNRTVQLAPEPKHSIELFYTGCGGMLIHSDDASILVDPFYSNTGLLRLLGKLRTDKANTDSVFQKIETQIGSTKQIRNVLLAHSHYDHILDFPYVLNTYLNEQDPQVIGSASARNALAAMPLAPYHFREPDFSKHCSFDTVTLTKNIRLFTICSDHAPHARLLGIPIHGMLGDIGQSGVKGFDTPAYQSSFQRWKEGANYSFLLEIQQPDRPKPFRIFIQSSSCAPPAGIPTFLKPADSVDLALIGVASTNLVEDYPRQLLKVLQPRYVLLIHWEDFFRAYGKSPKLVRGTRFKEFLTRYESVMGPRYAAHSSMPRPGTLFRFLY